MLPAMSLLCPLIDQLRPCRARPGEKRPQGRDDRIGTAACAVGGRPAGVMCQTIIFQRPRIVQLQLRRARPGEKRPQGRDERAPLIPAS